jgi:hypothetical protein
MAVGAWTSSLQTRVDSENYIAGTNTGVYNNASKLQQLWSVINTPTAFSVPLFTVANLQMYEFTVDQGTVANPVLIIFTSNTAQTVKINAVAGVLYYWDVNQLGVPGANAQPYGGIFAGSFITTTYTPFGVSLASATYTIPTIIGVATNFTGRIVYN